MPDRKKKDDPGTIAGRVKESLDEIRKHFSGKGARTRQDRYDRAADSAETGQKDPYQPTSRSVSEYAHRSREENREGTKRTKDY